MQDIVRDPNAWGAVAETYDELARERLTPFSQRAVEWAGLGESDDVLDVACGPGTTTVIAAKLARSVTARDFSPEMIEQLRRRTVGLGNVSASVGDGQALPYDDESFSAAFSMFGLMFFPDPVAGLRELHRVLRPGGRVVISSWVPMEESPMMRPMGAALMHAIPPAPDRQPPAPFAFGSAELLTEGLREGGFVDVEVQTFTPEFEVPSAEAYWDETRGNLIVNHIRKQAGDEWSAIEAKALDYLRNELADVERLAMPGFIGLGRKASG